MNAGFKIVKDRYRCAGLLDRRAGGSVLEQITGVLEALYFSSVIPTGTDSFARTNRWSGGTLCFGLDCFQSRDRGISFSTLNRPGSQPPLHLAGTTVVAQLAGLPRTCG